MAGVKEYFIIENENLIYKLIDLGVNFKSKEKVLRDISARIHNNQVGYIQFRDEDGNILKLYIVPKIFKEVDRTKWKEAFSKYIDFAFSLVHKYRNLSINEFKHLETLVSLYRKNLPVIGEFGFEYIIYLKYDFALRNIYKFFKQYRAYITEEVSYHSQTIKHKINLKKNIVEINKAKIHQIKKKKLIYSDLAILTYKVLNYFEKKILPCFTEELGGNLYNRLLRIRNLLRLKYKAHTHEHIKPENLLSFRVKSLFKNHTAGSLYAYLLTLMGIDTFEGSEQNRIITADTLAFFIYPEKVYEVFVYDYLITNCLKPDEIEFMPPPKEKYYISTKEAGEICKGSNPDIVVHRDKLVIVADVKWKMIKSINDISTDDILKLERDCRVWSRGKRVVPVLIYPVLKIEPGCVWVKYSNGDTFRFYVMEIFKTDLFQLDIAKGVAD